MSTSLLLMSTSLVLMSTSLVLMYTLVLMSTSLVLMYTSLVLMYTSLVLGLAPPCLFYLKTLLIIVLLLGKGGNLFPKSVEIVHIVFILLAG